MKRPLFLGRARTCRKALKREEVVPLREMADAGMPKAELARIYGISRETVYQYLKVAA